MDAREIRRSYRQLLRDPRWIEFRDRILATDDNSQPECWNCDSRDELDVHHLVYRDVAPWEYAEHEVRILCRRCHEAIHLVADLIWVECLRFQPHELEIILKRLKLLDDSASMWSNLDANVPPGMDVAEFLKDKVSQ